MRIQALVGETTGRALIKRFASANPLEGKRLLDEVKRVLGRLPEHGLPLSRLAAETLGDAHRLDAGIALEEEIVVEYLLTDLAL